MLYIITIYVLATALVYTWIREPRIFLFLYHKLIFPPRRGEPFVMDKNTYFNGSRLLEQNWETIRQELETVMTMVHQTPRFHHIDKANHKISFDNGPAWRTILLKAYGSVITTATFLLPVDC